jgi:hypothetical protein
MVLQIVATTENITLTGVIRAVDVASGVIALHLRSTEMKLRVNSNTRITVNGVHAPLVDLHPGVTAAISYDSRSLEAYSIAAQAAVAVFNEGDRPKTIVLQLNSQSAWSKGSR